MGQSLGFGIPVGRYCNRFDLLTPPKLPPRATEPALGISFLAWADLLCITGVRSPTVYAGRPLVYCLSPSVAVSTMGQKPREACKPVWL